MNQLDRIEKMLEYVTMVSLNKCNDPDTTEQMFYDEFDASFDEEDLLKVWQENLHQ